MAQYINLDEAIKHLQFDCKAKYPLSYCNGISVAIREIGKLATDDVVEVVRCKDCTHYIEMKGYDYNGRKARSCIWHGQLRRENDYCSDGIRKGGAK